MAVQHGLAAADAHVELITNELPEAREQWHEVLSGTLLLLKAGHSTPPCCCLGQHAQQRLDAA